MKTLTVKHFGPIVNDNGMEVEFKHVTVFCGNQGAGKSTVAKLFSEFSWIEKALTRGDFASSELTTYDRFRKKYCAFHNIQNYFHDNTYIRYAGDRYLFEYSGGHLNVSPVGHASYLRPQVLYIPAERNFMTALTHAEKIKRLPNALAVMMEEYDKALRYYKEPMALPVPGYNLIYDRLNKVSWLKGADFKIRIEEAASGFQSLVPLIMVSRYLNDKILHQDSDAGIQDKSVEEMERIQKSIQTILKDPKLDDQMRLSLIKEKNADIRNRRFVNIVEEPEQNLFPSSQRQVLYELLAINNAVPDNQLVLTTHSPYLLSYLTLCVKAGMLAQAAPGKAAAIGETVPQPSWMKPADVAIYQIDDHGAIAPLDNYCGLPSDNSYLNNSLEETNILFDHLLNIEGE